MRKLAIVANLGLLSWVLYMYLTEDADIEIALLVSCPAIMSLIALKRTSVPSASKSEESTFELARQALRAKLRNAAKTD